MSLVEKARQLLVARRRAYLQVFNPNNVFLAEVMADLARFCRAEESAFHQDPRAHALLEGRREVYLRIQDHLKLSEEEFLKKFGRKEPK